MRRFYLVLGGLAVAGAALLVWLVGRGRDVSIPVGVPIEITDTSGFRGYLLGSDSAPVEITEYADFQCPACRDFEVVQFPAVRRQLIETGQVRWRYRDYPLDHLHQYARLAAHAAACADDQGRYWQFHEMIYRQQDDWASGSATGKFRNMARSLGLDLAQYDACIRSEPTKYAGRIQASLNEGNQLGVPATPTFLIGGRLYPGVLVSDSIRALVQSLLPASGSPPKP
ncbi:MAG: DsbA family protein [Gemmatimonadales bacterium]